MEALKEFELNKYTNNSLKGCYITVLMLLLYTVLMNNAIYRKTMENIENRINVQLVNNEKDYLKCTSKPSYMSHKILDNNLVLVQESKLAIKLNKPAYIGMCILELGKVLMFEFYYDYVKNKCDSKSRLLFTDTDSLVYEIKIEDVCKDFSSDYCDQPRRALKRHSVYKQFEILLCSINALMYF